MTSLVRNHKHAQLFHALSLISQGVIQDVPDGEDASQIDLIKGLVKKYVAKSDCIVLLVVTCECVSLFAWKFLFNMPFQMTWKIREHADLYLMTPIQIWRKEQWVFWQRRTKWWTEQNQTGLERSTIKHINSTVVGMLSSFRPEATYLGQKLENKSVDSLSRKSLGSRKLPALIELVLAQNN